MFFRWFLVRTSLFLISSLSFSFLAAFFSSSSSFFSASSLSSPISAVSQFLSMNSSSSPPETVMSFEASFFFPSMIHCAVSTPVVLRASPKSQTLIVQSSLIRMLAGLRSLCSTLHEWMYFTAQIRLYVTVLICRICRWIADLITFLRSDSAYSSTMYSESKLSMSLGSMMSNSLTTNGWSILRSSLISLKIRLQSVSILSSYWI